MIQTTSGREEQPEIAVDEPERVDHEVDRDRHGHGRHETEAQDRRGEVVGAAEAQAREAVGRGHADHEREEGRRAGHQDRVLDVRQVVVLVDHLAVVGLDRGPVEVQRGRNVEQRQATLG
jgi:hypothetical protein